MNQKKWNTFPIPYLFDHFKVIVYKKKVLNKKVSNYKIINIKKKSFDKNIKNNTKWKIKKMYNKILEICRSIDKQQKRN